MLSLIIVGSLCFIVGTLTGWELKRIGAKAQARALIAELEAKGKAAMIDGAREARGAINDALTSAIRHLNR